MKVVLWIVDIWYSCSSCAAYFIWPDCDRFSGTIHFFEFFCNSGQVKGSQLFHYESESYAFTIEWNPWMTVLLLVSPLNNRNKCKRKSVEFLQSGSQREPPQNTFLPEKKIKQKEGQWVKINWVVLRWGESFKKMVLFPETTSFGWEIIHLRTRYREQTKQCQRESKDDHSHRRRELQRDIW